MKNKMTPEQVKMVEENICLVYPLINKYKALFPDNCVYDFEDLVQIGNMALIRAAQKFKTGSASCFHTYACVSVKNALINAAKHEYRFSQTYATDFSDESEDEDSPRPTVQKAAFVRFYSESQEEEMFGNMYHKDLVAVLLQIRQKQSRTIQMGIDALIMSSLGTSMSEFSAICGCNSTSLHTYVARARKVIQTDKRFIAYLDGEKR